MAKAPAPPERERDGHEAFIRRRCEEAGFPLTEARATILATVLELGTHPSADEVYAAAAKRQPGLGRATVYRTLEAFVRVGAFTKASHLGASVRYDAVVAPHHHLVCLRCNAIVDLYDASLDEIPLPTTGRLGFEVLDHQVQLRGTCRTCLEKEDES